MDLGNRIKTLRKNQNISQQKLGEYLNISFQAISKWENNTAYPDIRLLPALANFFGVSIDYLMENSEKEKTEEINDVINKYQSFFNEGKLEELVELLERTLRKYPNEYIIMLKLATTYHSISHSTHEHMLKEYCERAVELCNLIIEDSNDVTLSNSASTVMFHSLVALKRYRDAEEVANKRSSMYYSKEILLANLLGSEQSLHHNQSLILHLIDLLSSQIHVLSKTKVHNKTYSIEERIKINKVAISIIENTIYDKNYAFLAVRLRRYYTQLALLQARSNLKEEMYDSLEKAKELALYYDNREDEITYTSLLINTQVSRKSDIYRNNPITEIEIFNNRLERSEFNEYKNETRFQNLLSIA